MINPLFKIKIETNKSGFNFADIVILECFVKAVVIENKIFKAKIMGKVKNANAYVVSVFIIDKHGIDNDELERISAWCKGLKRKFGYPIRQIELEWGKFSGSMAEFIVPEHELTKVDE